MGSDPLPATRRIVTGHNAQVKATVARDDILKPQPTDHKNWVHTLWSSDSVPADANVSEDMALAKTGIIHGGSVIRILDIPPQHKGDLHRTISLDYIYCLKGTATLTLDDGSRVPVKENEFVVQQATMHGWDNETDDWVRLLCVLIAAKPVTVEGKQLNSEIGFTV